MPILEATRGSYLVLRIVAMAGTSLQLPAPSKSVTIAFPSGHGWYVAPAARALHIRYNCLPEWPWLVRRSSCPRPPNPLQLPRFCLWSCSLTIARASFCLWNCSFVIGLLAGHTYVNHAPYHRRSAGGSLTERKPPASLLMGVA